MMKIALFTFALFFSVVVIVTILTDPDPTVQASIQTLEVKDEYDYTWKSSIEPVYENPTRSKTTTR